jgi:hypothetical protein
MSESDSIINVLSLIYCNQVFAEFRAPVLVKYPDVLDDYLTKVTNPIDLGNLLLQALENELDVDKLRNGLQLIVSNALKFNEGFALMEGIVKHLEMFSKGLFEEMLAQPFHKIAEPKENEFPTYLLQERKRRYELIQNFPLNHKELDQLNIFLLKFLQKHKQFEKFFSSAFRLIDLKLKEMEKLLEDDEKDDEDEDEEVEEDEEVIEENEDETDEEKEQRKLLAKQRKDAQKRFPPVTFEEIIKNLFHEIQKYINNATSTPSSSTPVEARSNPSSIPLLEVFAPHLLPSLLSFKKLNFLSFLELLDKCLAIFLILTEERVYRGLYFCNRWSIPYEKCIWSPLTKKDSKGRQPWWPAMILVSNSSHYPMELAVMEKNIERIPAEALKMFMKYKPRITTSSSGNATPAVPNASLTTPMKGNNGTSNSEKQPLQTPITGADQSPSTKSEEVKLEGNEGQLQSPDSAVATASKKAPPRPPITSIHCPDGYLVVEYFGDHDLAWVKADITFPLNDDGTIPKLSKVCSPAVFQEAEVARPLIHKYLSSYGEFSLDGINDLSAIPSMEELKKEITPSEELLQAVRDYHTGGVSAAMKRKREKTEKSSSANNYLHEEDGEEQEEGGATALPQKSNSSSGAKRKRKNSNADNENQDENEDEAANAPRDYWSSPSKRDKKTVKPDKNSKEIYDKNHCILTRIPTPSKLLPRDFQKVTQYQEKYIVGNRMVVSHCPTAVPVELYNLNNPLPGYHFKYSINIRRSALVRTRGYVHWLNKVRPLPFPYHDPSNHHHNGEYNNNSNNNEFENETVHSYGTHSTSAAAIAQGNLYHSPPTKDSFNNNNNPNSIKKSSQKNPSSSMKLSSPSLMSSSSLLSKLIQIPVLDLPYETLGKIPDQEFFDKDYSTFLETGCSRYYLGKGLIYSRMIDSSNPLFCQEDRDAMKRKQKLAKELRLIQRLTEKLLNNEPETDEEAVEEEEREVEEDEEEEEGGDEEMEES